jgi:hypothetical protein
MPSTRASSEELELNPGTSEQHQIKRHPDDDWQRSHHHFKSMKSDKLQVAAQVSVCMATQAQEVVTTGQQHLYGVLTGLLSKIPGNNYTTVSMLFRSVYYILRPVSFQRFAHQLQIHCFCNGTYPRQLHLISQPQAGLASQHPTPATCLPLAQVLHPGNQPLEPHRNNQARVLSQVAG